MIIGHKNILNFLKRSIRNGRLAHAYLFIGPAHLGKRTVASKFINMLNGWKTEQNICPDVLIIEPEITGDESSRKESAISIKQIRQIQHQMSLSAYQANYKIALIDRADRMTTEAGNCLLKTLEEPSGRAILILTTISAEILLPTIVSRCQLIKFLPVSEKEIKKELNLSPQILRLSNGRPGLAIQYLNNPELLEKKNKTISQLEELLKADLNERYRFVEGIAKDVPGSRQILEDWLFWFRDLLLLKSNCSEQVIYPESAHFKEQYSLEKLKNIIEAIKETDSLLANPSINARLALEVLMLEL